MSKEGGKHAKTNLPFVQSPQKGTSLHRGPFMVEHWLWEECWWHFLQVLHRRCCLWRFGGTISGCTIVGGAIIGGAIFRGTNVCWTVSSGAIVGSAIVDSTFADSAIESKP